MAGIVAKKVKKQKTPGVLKHYDEIPEALSDGNFEPKCKYCGKEITGSTNLEQLVTCPTHKHGNLLDLILTDSADNIGDLTVHPLEYQCQGRCHSDICFPG